jgi:hypothetical protein
VNVNVWFSKGEKVENNNFFYYFYLAILEVISSSVGARLKDKSASILCLQWSGPSSLIFEGLDPFCMS